MSVLTQTTRFSTDFTASSKWPPLDFSGPASWARKWDKGVTQGRCFRDTPSPICAVLFFFSIRALRNDNGKAEHVIRSTTRAIRLATSGNQSANKMLLNWVCVMMLHTLGHEDGTQQRSDQDSP